MELGSLLEQTSSMGWSNVGALAVVVLLLMVIAVVLYIIKRTTNNDVEAVLMIVSKIAGIEMKLEGEIRGIKKGHERMAQTIDDVEKELTPREMQLLGSRIGIANLAQKVFERVVKPILLQKFGRNG